MIRRGGGHRCSVVFEARLRHLDLLDKTYGTRDVVIQFKFIGM